MKIYGVSRKCMDDWWIWNRNRTKPFSVTLLDRPASLKSFFFAYSIFLDSPLLGIIPILPLRPLVASCKCLLSNIAKQYTGLFLIPPKLLLTFLLPLFAAFRLESCQPLRPPARFACISFEMLRAPCSLNSKYTPGTVPMLYVCKDNPPARQPATDRPTDRIKSPVLICLLLAARQLRSKNCRDATQP